jgi:hypothetical protein
MGMGFGILLSKRNPSLLATFGVLSSGYLLSSYNECRSIQLPTLNRARFSVAVRTFLESGKLQESPSYEDFVSAAGHRSSRLKLAEFPCWCIFASFWML